MATIREYFDTDARALTVHKGWPCSSREAGTPVEVIAKIAYDFEANAKYWYIYVPETSDLPACLHAIFSTPELAECRLGPEGDGALVEMGHSDYSERLSSSTLQFTRRVHLYLDFDGSAAERRSLVTEVHAKGFFLSVRDKEYARKRSESEKPLAFISHDSRDKDSLVRDLAHQLVRLMCPVWYDEYSLQVGDSLRASIERGLKEARKCIIVLSPNFLWNEGWSKAEFDSIFTREILEGTNVILPVWHNVGAQEIYDYSPRLADKVGLPSSLGVEELARRLSVAVKNAA
jgi:hypothetical protein